MYGYFLSADCRPGSAQWRTALPEGIWNINGYKKKASHHPGMSALRDRNQADGVGAGWARLFSGGTVPSASEKQERQLLQFREKCFQAKKITGIVI